MSSNEVPQFSGDLSKWAKDVSTYLSNLIPISEAVAPTPVLLPHQRGGLAERAGTAGILMYDPTALTPVVSDGSVWCTLACMIDNTSSNNIQLGDTLIQWGVEAASGASATVTFPESFGDANSTVIVNAQNDAYAGTVTAGNFLMTGTNGDDKHWIAIGSAV
jgi:hypothetical protein